MSSCIYFYCSLAILVTLEMYVVQLKHFSMNYLVCNCLNLVEVMFWFNPSLLYVNMSFIMHNN